jgi:hypothetical protein
MDAGQHAVCVALNDNDRAWYEMLVPFILSLRQTNYQGHIAVIGYGLSQRKIEILRAQSVNVLEAGTTPLAYGRFLEVARLAEMNPGISKLALYDADIWFSSAEFDLFSLIEGDDIHVCKDAYLCDFVTDPLIGPDREHHRLLVEDEVLRRYGSALQAGLIAGTARAWREFAAHVQGCVDRIGRDFRTIYGLDTTFLHLWGAQVRVGLLPVTQNFVVKDGLIERRTPAGAPLLLSQYGPVRGLHMMSDIRFIPCWRYFGIHRDHALDAGRAFALPLDEEWRAHAIPPDFARMSEEVGLEIEDLSGESTAAWNAFRTVENVTIIGHGEHEITMRVRRPLDPLVINVMYLSGSPGPIRARFSLAGQEIVIGKDLSQWGSMSVEPGAELRLRTESLPGQRATIVWTLSSKHALSQS